MSKDQSACHEAHGLKMQFQATASTVALRARFVQHRRKDKKGNEDLGGSSCYSLDINTADGGTLMMGCN